MDCVKRALNERGMSVEQGSVIVIEDRGDWSAMVTA